MSESDADICDWTELPSKPDPCDPYDGMVLPLFGEWENAWPQYLKIILYLAGLIWCFMGVAIISDVFMGAIERVTSKKKLALNPKTGRKVTVKVWNDTVANLSLMALGSSAPEILLSLIELMGMNNFKSGELGPSTIVGSAAFNLFCITAVCICAIPPGEVRKIKDTNVFIVTASFSIFAYFWLIFIVLINSKDVITIWEGVMTFLLFFILMLLAYLTDINVCGKRSAGKETVQWNDVSEDEFAAMQMEVRKQHGEFLTDEQVLMLMEYEFSASKSRALYRVGATRDLFQGKKVMDGESGWQQGKKVRESLRNSDPGGTGTENISNGNTTQEQPSIIAFCAKQYAVLESAGTVNITVERRGNMDTTVTVEYRTRDGTASAGSDYQEKFGVLEFAPNEETKMIDIRIIDDTEHEETEEFYVDLLSAECPIGDGTCTICGDTSFTTVVIIDDDEPGQLAFEHEQTEIQESAVVEVLSISVVRTGGGCGRITCTYRTEDDSAIQGCDYSAAQGELVFLEGEIEKVIEVEILPKGRYEQSERFRVVLESPSGGATFDPETDGGAEMCILTVSIIASADAKDRIDSMMRMCRMNWDRVQLGHANWKEQFVEAIFCGGSREEQREASWFSMIIHWIILPWKLLFAFVPPTDYLEGWVCFSCALLMIGIVTAIIGDLANLLGCAIPSFTPSITAITFVALGTSLPDTFASWTAAQQDPHADACIGNITGSNSVNVFLGLGLPWLIGSIYWKVTGPIDSWKEYYVGSIPTDTCKQGAFVVRSEGLTFTVLVFSICAVIALFFLYCRRKVVGGELGGNKRTAQMSSAFLVFLWCAYVGLSVWNIQTNTF